MPERQQISRHIIRETIDAITKWEIRIDIKNTSVEIICEEIFIKVEWTLKNSDIGGFVEVTL